MVLAGGAGDRAILCEGFLAKPAAALATGLPGVVLGWGSRSWLASKSKLPPSIKRVLIANDRRPDAGELGDDGDPLVDGHDRDVRDGADRFLLELGDDAVELAADPGVLFGLKDLDEVLRTHGIAAVRELLERTKPATLSESGWIRRLSGLSDLEYEQRRAEFAKAAGGRRSTLDGLRKKGQQGAADVDEVTIREQLIAIALEKHEHFVDGADDAFGIIPVAGKRTVGCRVYSTAYRRWLVREYGQRNQVKLPSGVRVPRGAPAQAVAEALDAIAAHAANAATREPKLRVAWAADRSTVYLDLARAEDGAVVEIDAAGWRVVDWAPVPLVYAESALPLPIPIQPNDVSAVVAELEYLFGFKREDDEFVLLLGFLIHCLMPGGPYILLFITGERGSGKSTRARVIKLTVDPTKIPLRFRPASRDDLAISAMRQGLPAYDNVSSIPQDMSDALCVILDGGGLGKRRLYSNDEETLIEAQRPVIATAIPDILRAGDLLERAITIEVPILDEKIDEKIMEDALEALRPRLLGLLCTGVSRALAVRHDRGSETVRRAGAVRFVEAAIEAFGIAPGRFRAAYRANQEAAFMGATAADPVGAAVMQLMDGRTTSWEGRAQALLTALTSIQRSVLTELPTTWPRTANILTGRLRRLAPDLRALGIGYQKRRSDGAWVRLTPIFARTPKRESWFGSSEASERPIEQEHDGVSLNRDDEPVRAPDAAVGNGPDAASSQDRNGADEHDGVSLNRDDAPTGRLDASDDPNPDSLFQVRAKNAGAPKRRSRVRRGPPA